ncbi:D-alanyl-D-alanine carboxypeptidase [Streptomyces sp. NPDC048751]|uniref:D-alanyl-D-alanine carboxypeptidase n=1 Tax=Streptomyces sp. NPDC048751 TaxID=3365591 RepID=UPI00371446A2
MDTATRVFSVRRSETGDVESAEDDSAEATAEAETPEDTEGSAQDPAPTDSESRESAEDAEDAEDAANDTTGDARLRAAVAAWVQTAEDKPPTQPDSSETVTQPPAKPARASKDAPKSSQDAEEAGKTEHASAGSPDAEAPEQDAGTATKDAQDAAGAAKPKRTSPKAETGTRDAEQDAGSAEKAEQDAAGDKKAERASTASAGSQAGKRGPAGAREAKRASAGAQGAAGAVGAAGGRGGDDTKGAPEAQDADEAAGAGARGEEDSGSDTAEDRTDVDAASEAAPGADSDTDESAPKATGGSLKAGAAAKAGSEGDAQPKRGTKGETDSATSSSTAKADPEPAETESPAKADAEPTDTKPADSKTPAKADPRVGTDAPAKADAKPSAAASAKAGAKPDADAKPSADTPAKADAKPEADAKPDTDTDDSPTAPPVDQPTAVFKAPRAAKPAVDQPTTMLKLGDAARAGQKSDRKPEGKTAEDKVEDKKPGATEADVEDKKPGATEADVEDKKPGATEADVEDKKPGATEADVERTSKFVALKPLDDPSTRKPPPADATTALPRVKPADATSPVPQLGTERTTQQPLPPKPPLDLLAELTNTPPPPETPLRTTVRRVKIWTPIVLLLVVVFAIVQAVRPLPTPSLVLTAEESYTFKGDKVSLPWPNEGQGWMDVNGIGNVDGFGEQKPVAIGSVAKAMTAYVVLKDHPLKQGTEGPSITIDALAEKEGGYDKYDESTVNTVKEGDKYTLKQALSAVMIPSANNIARLLARWDAGNEAAFIKKMNATARELGMKHTKYTDASGLKETTVSTAEDQVKLGHELVKIPALMDITKQPNWVDPTGFKWRNYNDLVPYNNAIGIKTGSTSKAGGNLLFAATKEVGGETVTLVGAILAQHNAVSIIDQVNKVSKTAMLATQDALTSAKILKKGDVVGYVDDQLGNRTPVVVTKDVSAVGWAGLKVKLSFATDDVPHTAKAGTKVGSLTVGDGTGDAVKVPVALQKDLAEPGFTDKLTRVG